jgi:hypothetical protein
MTILTALPVNGAAFTWMIAAGGTTATPLMPEAQLFIYSAIRVESRAIGGV